jgi:hypothetical protein
LKKLLTSSLLAALVAAVALAQTPPADRWLNTEVIEGIILDSGGTVKPIETIYFSVVNGKIEATTGNKPVSPFITLTSYSEGKFSYVREKNSPTGVMVTYGVTGHVSRVFVGNRLLPTKNADRSLRVTGSDLRELTKDKETATPKKHGAYIFYPGDLRSPDSLVVVPEAAPATAYRQGWTKTSPR